MHCSKQHPHFDRFADAGLHAQSPENNLAKVGVEGSNPFARSIRLRAKAPCRTISTPSASFAPAPQHMRAKSLLTDLTKVNASCRR